MRIAGEPLPRLVWESIARPGEAARVVLSQRFDRDVLWSALALVSVLSTLLVFLRGILFPAEPAPVQMPDGQTFDLVLSPFAFAFIVFALLTILVFVLDQVGRVLGGRGELTTVLMAVAWTQVVFLAVDFGLLMILVIAPPFAGLAALIALVLMARASVHFLDAAHGFGSLGRAAATLLVSLLGVFIGMGLIIALITSAASAFGGAS